MIPYTSVADRLQAEDGVAFSNLRTEKRLATGSAIRIAVLQLPTIANFDDLDPLIAEPDVDLVHVTPGAAIPGDPDLVVLPGTKSTLADLEFIRGQGWDIDLTAHWRRGGHILEICGGYQLLGQRVADPAGIEGPCGQADALGFLEITTELETRKILGETRGHHIPSGAAVGGYEIHLGRTTGPACDRPMLALDGRNGGAMSTDGRVQGCYLHGLFTADAFSATPTSTGCGNATKAVSTSINPSTMRLMPWPITSNSTSTSMPSYKSPIVAKRRIAGNII